MIKETEILALLEKEPDQDAQQVARDLQMTFESAGMILLRLFRQGLLKRELDRDNRLFFYSLSEKGQERLHYLQNYSNSWKECHAQKSSCSKAKREFYSE